MNDFFRMFWNENVKECPMLHEGSTIEELLPKTHRNL